MRVEAIVLQVVESKKGNKFLRCFCLNLGRDIFLNLNGKDIKVSQGDKLVVDVKEVPRFVNNFEILKIN